ncbi:OmpA family protein [Aureispira anguillae]|uniref:OmpA-like domain-containing protein n=1 Tax=Aureispira anguillae TaxID=2864201 RepID=A0A915YI64_9BACT|nr:hypothetical protein [Aureispira anguillae]BDS13459.1 hypothetical protein AsAng_0041970 [Aureispira anguillae]
MTRKELEQKAEALRTLNKEKNKCKKEFSVYKKLLEKAGGISAEEQAQLDKIEATIAKVEEVIAIKRQKILQISTDLKSLKRKKEDDPIERQIDYQLSISLETFITIKYWRLDQPNEAPVILPKVELENETDFPIVSIPSNTKVEVYTWAKAIFIDANLLTSNDEEVLQKDFSATIHIDKKGKFSLLDSNETVTINNHEKLKGYDITLGIKYISGGASIRLQANGLAKGKTLEESYKNWDSKDKKTAFVMTDQVLKSIAPTLVLQPEKYIAPAPISKKLIFESENQAILSCDQLRTLQDWWKGLKDDLKNKVKNREAYIEVIGYTTTTGNDLYNYNLAGDRAFDVGRLLAGMIGITLEGKSIADIRPISEGENTDNPNRYVKILIVIK